MSDPKYKRTRFLSPRETKKRREKKENTKTSRTHRDSQHTAIYEGKKETRIPMSRERASARDPVQTIESFSVEGWPVCATGFTQFFSSVPG
jgi:hypothetical protein